MKFKVGDQVIVTAGKDKGKTSTIVRVLPKEEKVVVEGVNLYTKHVRPMGDRPGERVRRPRPLPTAKIAILNDEGKPDRIGVRETKSGQKERIYKKTGKVIETKKTTKK
jgi:large subunit ribosomal protein L24